jgi:phosphoglucosamine mutase
MATPIACNLSTEQGACTTAMNSLFLMVTDRLARDEVVPGVVGTLMTNMAVELAIKAKHIEFVRSKVGDRYVLEVLRSKRNGCWVAKVLDIYWP